MIIEKQFQKNNFMEQNFQIQYLTLLNSFNPKLVIKPLKIFNFNVNKSLELMGKLSNKYGVLLLNNKLGNFEVIKEEITLLMK